MTNRLAFGFMFVVALIVMAMPAYAIVPMYRPFPKVMKAQQTCQQDADCSIVRTLCLSCCPDLRDSEAVNKKYVNGYAELGKCTDAHIKSCGVPECGLMSPAPAAICRAGQCVVVMEFQGKRMLGPS